MDILTSLHGRRIGLGRKNELIVRNPFGLGSISGSALKLVSSAQLLALNATPVTVIPAPPTGHINVVQRWAVRKPAGTAYAGIGAGEDLILKYSNAAGAIAAPAIASAGFLDQTTEQIRHVYTGAALAATPENVIVGTGTIVIHLLVGEITTGDSPLHLAVWYNVIETNFTALG